MRDELNAAMKAAMRAQDKARLGTIRLILAAIKDRDLAILNVETLPPGVIPAVLSGGVQPGERVMAIGAPFGLEGSVTAGIVSATGRTFVVEETGQVLADMIQFDAAANPGNSGGPLVDLSGRVVGIVTGLVNPTEERVFVGLGFAVPIESAGGRSPLAWK